jgi:hypothetical protein
VGRQLQLLEPPLAQQQPRPEQPQLAQEQRDMHDASQTSPHCVAAGDWARVPYRRRASAAHLHQVKAHGQTPHHVPTRETTSDATTQI